MEDVIVYACKTAWDHEIDATQVDVYPSVESLKAHCRCWEECGIVALRVTFVEEVIEGTV